MKEILNSDSFNINDNFLFIKSSKEEIKYSTKYTLINLEYDSDDVINNLKELTLQEYSETLIDKDDDNPPLLFVFGKDINYKQVYIKLKIREMNQKIVLCLSFHYAKYKMKFPYK